VVGAARRVERPARGGPIGCSGLKHCGYRMISPWPHGPSAPRRPRWCLVGYSPAELRRV
jgi:hypothetical protein